MQRLNAKGDVATSATAFQQGRSKSQEDPRKLLLLIQKAPNWRALKQLHYQRVCISHPLLSVTVLCQLPNLVLPVHAVLTNPDIRELQEFVAFLVNEVDNSVLKKGINIKLPAPERSKLCGLLVKSVYALSLLDLPDCPKREWIPRLCGGILSCADSLTAEDVVTCVWAVSQLHGTNPSNEEVLSLAACGLHVLEDDLPRLSLQHTSWLLVGLAKLQPDIPPKLLKNTVQHAVQQVEAARQGVACDALDVKTWYRAGEQAAVLLQALSDFFTAMVELKYRPSAQVMMTFTAGTDSLLQHSPTQAIPNLLYSMVKLGQLPSHAWMQEYFAASETQLRSYKGSVLARQAWAVVQANRAPPYNWLSSLATMVSLRAHLLQFQDLATCCRCIRHFEFQPPAVQLGNIIAALPDTAALDTNGLFLVLEVYACCGVRPKQALAEKLEAASKQLLQTMSLEQFSMLILALQRPGWACGRELADNFVPRAGGQLQAASPSQLTGFLKALKVAKYVCWNKTQLLPFVNRMYQVCSDLSPLQCIEVLEGVAATGLWPFTEISPAAMAASPSAISAARVKAIPLGLVEVAPVPWLSAILDRLRQGGETLQADQCSAVLNSLRELASSSPNHTESLALTSQSLLQWLEKQLYGKLQTIQSTSGLSGLCLAFTLLGHTPSSSFIIQWRTAVSSCVASLSPADALLVMLGIKHLPAALQPTCRDLVERVLYAAAGQVDNFPEVVIDVLVLAADLGSSKNSAWMTDSTLLEGLIQKLKLKWAQMSPEALAKAVKLLASLRCQIPAAVLQLHANSMYPKAGTASISAIADVVWSYGQLDFALKSSQQDKLLVTLAEASTESLTSCDAAALIASMRELQQRSMGRLADWMPALEAALNKDLQSLSTRDIAAAVLLLESQGHQPAPALADRVASALDGLQPDRRSQDAKLAADMLRVFAGCGYKIKQQTLWLNRLVTQQQAALAELPAAQLQAWVWQYSRVRYLPPDKWLAVVLPTLHGKLVALDAAGLVQVVESLCNLGIWHRLSLQQKQQFLDSLWQHFTSVCKEVSSAAGVQHFCSMLHWLAHAGYAPDAEGRDWLNKQLKVQKKLLPFYTTTQLVWLLGSLSPLGNRNTFMAQELRSTFMSRTNAGGALTAAQLAEGLAASASAPGPTPSRFVEELKGRIWACLPGGSDGSPLPNLVWALAVLQGKLDRRELQCVCMEVAAHTSSLTAQDAYRFLEGLACLAGSSLWDSEVYGAAAIGQLLDRLCSLQVLQPHHLAPATLVNLMQRLLCLGYTPDTGWLDAAVLYLVQPDPLATQLSMIMPLAVASPHIGSLNQKQQQQLQEALSQFGYDMNALNHKAAGVSMGSPSSMGSPTTSPPSGHQTPTSIQAIAREHQTGGFYTNTQKQTAAGKAKDGIAQRHGAQQKGLQERQGTGALAGEETAIGGAGRAGKATKYGRARGEMAAGTAWKDTTDRQFRRETTAGGVGEESINGNKRPASKGRKRSAEGITSEFLPGHQVKCHQKGKKARRQSEVGSAVVSPVEVMTAQKATDAPANEMESHSSETATSTYSNGEGGSASQHQAAADGRAAGSTVVGDNMQKGRNSGGRGMFGGVIDAVSVISQWYKEQRHS